MRIGTRILNVGIIGLSSTRALAYSSLLGGPHDGAGPQILSDHGEWLWLYVTLWTATAIIAGIEIITGTTKASVLIAIFMCSAWSMSYFTAWGMAHYQTQDWMTGFLYASFALVFVAVKRLIDQLEKYYAQSLTGMLERVGE